MFFSYSNKEIFLYVVVSVFLAAGIFWGGMHFYMSKKAESNQFQQHNYVIHKEQIDDDLFIYTIKEKVSERKIEVIRDVKHDTTEIVKGK